MRKRFLKVIGAVLATLLPSIALATTLLVPQGGTGITTCNDGGLILGNGTAGFVCLGAGASGQVLQGTGGDPQWVTLDLNTASIGTSTVPNIGEIAYWTSLRTLGTVATGTLTTDVVGLSLSQTRALLGGSAILSLDSGYTIPSTTRMSNLDSFYTTPSSRITAGTNLSWSGNTLNVIGGGIGTSTNPNIGNLAYWTGVNTLGTVATGTLTESITGLELDATRGLVGGSAILALTSGYAVPTTTRLVNHDTAYSWGNHASQGYITDGNTNWDNSYGYVTQGQTVGTSTAGVAGQASYWTGIRTLGTVATGTLTENILGIDLDNSTRGLFGGSAQFTLTSGYTIPSTTRAVAWDNKGTGSVTSVDMSVPTGLSISGNPITTAGTLALTLTGGYAIPSTTRLSNHDTAYTWGNHVGLYDPLGQATSTLGTHTTTYNHANYNTAFGWGNHAGLYDPLGQATSTLGTHTTTYNHTNYNTAYSWGNHAGLYDPLGQATSSINLLTGGAGLTRTLNDFFCDTASGSVFGCLTSTDWNAFDDKVSTTSSDTEVELENWLTDVTNVLTNNDTNAVTPNMVLSTGQTDEFCLTYEATGSTWEWATCGTGGGGGSGGGWATTTDSNPEAGELVTYTNYDAYIGGSSASTAVFNFEPESSKLTIASTTAVATGTIFSQAGAIKMGSSTGESVEFNFNTSNTLKLFSGTGVNLFDFGGFNLSAGNATTSSLGVLNLTASNCDVKSTTGGALYCGTDATGSGVTSVDMTVPTGLSISGNPVTTSGTLALALTAGYAIPTTTRLVNHDTAFSWGNHASAGYDQVTTAGDGLTRTVNDFDCDIASGSVFGCLSSTDWNTFNSKGDVSKVGTPVDNQIGVWTGDGTIEGDTGLTFDSSGGYGDLYIGGDGASITGSDPFYINVTGGGSIYMNTATAEFGRGSEDATIKSSGNYNLILQTGNTTTGNITIVDGANGNISLTPNGTGIIAIGGDGFTSSKGTTTNATSTTLFSALGTFTNIVVNTLATFLNVTITGLLDIGAGVLEIPNGTAPVIDSIGEMGLDSTDDQLIMADGGGTARVFGTDEFRVISITMASTSNWFASGKSLSALSYKDGLELTQFRCYVVGGTSKVVNVTDGTNDTETITCGTTITSDTDVATADTFTADELGYIEMGATTGTVDTLHFEAWARITRE